MKFKNHTKIKLQQFGKINKNKWKIKLLNKYLNKNSLILDIGCAAGNISNFVPNKENYYGLEYNDDFIEAGKELGINIHFCDLHTGKLPIEDNVIDVVYFSHVIEHLESRKQVGVMREIYRVLKPNGKVIIFCPSAYNPFFYDNCTHVRPFTHGSIKHLMLDVGFTNAIGKYSLLRYLPESFNRILRLTPLRWLLWEVIGVGIK